MLYNTKMLYNKGILNDNIIKVIDLNCNLMYHSFLILKKTIKKCHHLTSKMIKKKIEPRL